MKKKNENITIEKLSTSAFQNHQKRDLKVAEKLYKKILKLNPNHFESNFYLGIISAQTNNFNKAKQLLNKAIQIQPNFIDAHYNLGNVQNELGEFEQAASSYQKAIEIQPNYASAYHNLGFLLSNLGKYDEATQSCRQAIKIKTDYAKAYSMLLFNLNYKTDFNPNLYLTEARKFRINCKPKKSLSFKHQYEKKPTKLRLGLISADFGNHPGGFHTLSTLRELRKKILN